jgi:hypothetical protein
MAELDTSKHEPSCCGPDAQAACCEPGEKTACCGELGESCSCTAGAAALAVVAPLSSP